MSVIYPLTNHHSGFGLLSVTFVGSNGIMSVMNLSHRVCGHEHGERLMICNIRHPVYYRCSRQVMYSYLYISRCLLVNLLHDANFIHVLQISK